MKQNKNIFLSLGSAAALIIATMFASCTKAELEAPVVKQSAEIRFGIEKNIISKPLTKSGSESDSRVLVDYDPNDPNSIGLSMTVVDGIETPVSNLPATKGTQITQKEQLTAFDVVSYFYADESAEDGSFVFEDIVSDGVNTTKTYYWPSFGEMNFIATYPAGLFGKAGIKSIADADGHLKSFSYTIPETVLDQQDIMIAVTNDVDCTAGGQVPLQFKHLLSAVQFKVGKMVATRINSLTISGVKGGTVTMTYDAANDKWNYQASSNNVSYSPIYLVAEDTPNVDTYGMAEGNYITNNDNKLVMFVMPQTLDGATLSLSYTEQITGTTHNCEATLTGHSWEVGKTLTYVININAETLQITIPTPPDADAHYVRIDMSYDLSGLSHYEEDGIEISNIKADARWLEDNSNTASVDKQGIYIKTTLTEMQSQDYFTDEEWTWEYTLDSDGNIVEYKTGSANGPKCTKSNILGSEEQILAKGSAGTLYLFLDENNGTTDRNGVLEVTADVTQNGRTRSVILGSGAFKQLCPSWNNSGLGVERIEDALTYPFGFSYNKIIKYRNPDAEKYADYNPIIQGIIGIIRWILGGSSETVLPEIDDNLAEGFVDIDDETKDVWGNKIVKSITLNYAALNNLKGKANNVNGLINTRELYNHTGEVDIAELEAELDRVLLVESSGWVKDPEISTGDSPSDYAAFMALTRNRMRELIIVVTQNGKPSKTTKAILHKVGEGGANNTGDESGTDIIEWYLPSSEEMAELNEVGTGTEQTPISPLNGTYWSSTAGDDPVEGTNGFAYSQSYSNNTVVGVPQATDRSMLHQVRAVRKR